jgi:hypothetical protein
VAAISYAQALVRDSFTVSQIDWNFLEGGGATVRAFVHSGSAGDLPAGVEYIDFGGGFREPLGSYDLTAQWHDPAAEGLARLWGDVPTDPAQNCASWSRRNYQVVTPGPAVSYQQAGMAGSGYTERPRPTTSYTQP